MATKSYGYSTVFRTGTDGKVPNGITDGTTSGSVTGTGIGSTDFVLDEKTADRVFYVVNTNGKAIAISLAGHTHDTSSGPVFAGIKLHAGASTDVAQKISTSSEDPIEWRTKVFGNDNYKNSSNNKQLIAYQAGIYCVSVIFSLTRSYRGRRVISWKIDGGDANRFVEGPPSPDGWFWGTGSTLLKLSANSYVEIIAGQTSGEELVLANTSSVTFQYLGSD